MDRINSEIFKCVQQDHKQLGHDPERVLCL
jgi:hypothetical protein